MIEFSGRGKQLCVARNKVRLLPSLLPSRRIERVPSWIGASSNSRSDRSGVVKASEGGAISLPHGWSTEKVPRLFILLSYKIYFLPCILLLIMYY